MCLLERNTARRGRAVVPRTFLRTRRWRRSRETSRFCICGPLLRRLAGLAQHALVDVADALALVRLRLANLANVGGHLADELLVEALHRDAGGAGHLELHTLGRVDRDRVREAELQVDAARPRGGGAVADADDLQLLGEALRHARHHVGDQRTGETVQRAVLALVVGTTHEELVALTGDGDVDGRVVLEGPLRTLDRDVVAVERHVDAARDRDGLLADSRHRVLRYQTWHRTSPPTRRWRASRSVMSPWLVERMAM